MRNILIISVFLVLSSCIQEKDKRIHITGELPVIQDSYAKMFIEQDGKRVLFRTAVKEGKFNLYFDSLEKGPYTFIFEWSRPFEKRYMTYRDKGGKVVRRYLPQVIRYIVLSKNFYINPEQSLSYFIKPEKEITNQMIEDFDSVSYRRTDLYRLKAVSDAEDTQLFERLDSLKQYFTGLSMYLVFDSLYRNSKRPDKIEQDFSSLATKMNFEKNYPTYLQSRKEIIEHHLDNPIAAMNLLDVGKDYFIANVEEYENLIDRMSGRARDSPYYNRLRLKIDGLKDPFSEGKVLPLPVGNTPNGKPLTFTPSNYKYTLVEFWASWCGPCRVQNPEWNELLYNYKDKGFKILGVSLDLSAANWKKAIEGDHLDDWLHIADLEDGFKGSNALRYGIQAIPFNILIDQEGRVVTKDIGPVDMEDFLVRNL